MDEAAEPPSIDATLREVARTRRIVAALLHGPDAADVDDVLQDASVAALASDAPRGEAFAHWIRGAVRHLSVTVLRRRERRSIREREAARQVALPAADELAQRFALHRALLAAIEALSEPLRVAIVRRYFDDAKPREIAREQGCRSRR
jgi:RNA polymerase sigma factor (sigma-70 family)